MKSTAFMGALELVGDISDLRVKDEWLVMSLRTTTPAGWNMKVALSHDDVMAMLRLLIKPKNLGYVLFGFGRPSDKKRAPDY